MSVCVFRNYTPAPLGEIATNSIPVALFLYRLQSGSFGLGKRYAPQRLHRLIGAAPRRHLCSFCPSIVLPCIPARHDDDEQHHGAIVPVTVASAWRALVGSFDKNLRSSLHLSIVPKARTLHQSTTPGGAMVGFDGSSFGQQTAAKTQASAPNLVLSRNGNSPKTALFVFGVAQVAPSHPLVGKACQSRPRLPPTTHFRARTPHTPMDRLVRMLFS